MTLELETALTIRRQFLTNAIAFDIGTDSFKDVTNTQTQRSNITTAKLLPVINVTDSGGCWAITLCFGIADYLRSH